MLMCELDVMEYAVTMEEALIEELNDFDDFYEEVLDRYDECGFNPYMGCYDFDCQSKSRGSLFIEHMFVWSGPLPGRDCEKFNAIVSI